MKGTAINYGDNTFNCGEEPDVTATGVNKSELGRIERALSQLAAGLDPEKYRLPAKKEAGSNLNPG